MLNPIKQIRLDHKLSQKDLASLSGVTPQVVTKTESGVYPEVPPNISKAIFALTGESMLDLTDRYERWIEEKLKEIVLPENAPFGTPAQMKNFREEVCALNDVPNTIIAFSTLLSIHPYVIEKYEKNRMKDTPRQLIERVNQIGRLRRSPYKTD